MEIKICFVINHETLPAGRFSTKKVFVSDEFPLSEEYWGDESNYLPTHPYLQKPIYTLRDAIARKRFIKVL